VDPRSIAQRIMDIRTQLSEEFIQELQAIAEENSLLLRCAAWLGACVCGVRWWPSVGVTGSGATNKEQVRQRSCAR
jgi:hypothetical protein